MLEQFMWKLSNGSMPSTIVVDNILPLSEAMANIGLRPPRPTIAVVGGVNIDDTYVSKLQVFFCNVLAPLAQSCQAVVVDGGTNFGIMKFMGQARASIDGTFPLVGVMPAEKILEPGRMPNLELETNHTHFVLSPGNEWGDESPWLARVVSTISSDAPSLTILANGGDIAWLDVAASIAQGRKVVIMAGTGRTADKLAEDVRDCNEGQRLTKAFATYGLLHVLDIDSGEQSLRQSLLSLLHPKLHVPHSVIPMGR